MELFFSPIACSMATRISLYEADLPARFVLIDTKSGKTADGEDFSKINPLGQVPVIRTDDGQILTENTAILQYVADQAKAVPLAPNSGFEKHRLREWLSFISTELHKGLFGRLFDDSVPAEVKKSSIEASRDRFAKLDRHLQNREFLLDQFTVADSYLVTVLNWAQYVGIDLNAWPNVLAYYKHLTKRPSVAKALAEEYEIYQKTH